MSSTSERTASFKRSWAWTAYWCAWAPNLWDLPGPLKLKSSLTLILLNRRQEVRLSWSCGGLTSVLLLTTWNGFIINSFVINPIDSLPDDVWVWYKYMWDSSPWTHIFFLSLISHTEWLEGVVWLLVAVERTVIEKVVEEGRHVVRWRSVLWRSEGLVWGEGRWEVERSEIGGKGERWLKAEISMRCGGGETGVRDGGRMKRGWRESEVRSSPSPAIRETCEVF